MCGRFYIDTDDMSDAELIALLDREQARADLTGDDRRVITGEVRPGDCTAVIALNRQQKRSAFVMQWGFHHKTGLIINARSETASERPMFRQSMQIRRCLIPASAYFEWDHREKPFQKYRFSLPDIRCIYLAGIYRFEESASQPTFTILTREAPPSISCFHDRMPVIIPPQLRDAWLDQHHSADVCLMKASAPDIIWEKAV